MNVNGLDLAVIGFYFLLLVAFAYLTRRTKTFTDFSIAGHSVPGSMVFASLAATLVGPGFSVGMTSKGFVSGHAFYILALPFALQTILVGWFLAPRLSALRDCHTLGDVMARSYGKFTHFLTGFVSVGLCIGFSAIMLKIGGGILSAATGLDLMLCILVVAAIAALYTASGGIRASIATDGLQFSIFTIIIPTMLVLAFFKTMQSPSEIAASASALTQSGFSGMGKLQILAVLLSFLLGETLVPPYANRALAAKSGAASRRGFLLAGGFAFVWLGIVTTLGVYGRALLPSDVAPDDVFFGLGSLLFPHGIFGLLLAAVIAIVMSSLDSVMNAGAVALTKDVVGFMRPVSHGSALRMSRYGTILIAVCAAVVARYSPSIIEGLLICYSIWAPTILIPLIVGLFRRCTVHAAGWLSMLCGGVTSVIWQTVLQEPAGIPAILAGLVASVLGYLLGAKMGRVRTNDPDAGGVS